MACATGLASASQQPNTRGSNGATPQQNMRIPATSQALVADDNVVSSQQEASPAQTPLVAHERQIGSARGETRASVGTSAAASESRRTSNQRTTDGPSEHLDEGADTAASRASTPLGGGQRQSQVAPPAEKAPEQSEEMRAELEECRDTITWCAQSVTRESLQAICDVKSTAKPAPMVKDVLETVALLLGQPETKWDKLKRFVSSPTFLEKVQRLNLDKNVSREQFRKLRDKLRNPDFDEELIKTVSVAVVPLAMWCRTIGVYLGRTKFRGGPDIQPVAAAGASSPPAPPRPSRVSTPGVVMVFEPDLERLSSEEIRHVRDLTISRPGVGKVTFHGETDCTDMDFERIVQLEVGEVLVYPESNVKPPPGTGLNKAATVTMYQCWPPNGSQMLKDVKSQERYKNKIREMTEQKQALFLDYDCATGIWKFSVDHF